MKNVIKWMVTIAIMLTIIGNTAYITQKVTQISTEKDMIIRMMESGVGVNSTHQITGQMYGRTYTVTIKADDYGMVQAKTSWK